MKTSTLKNSSKKQSALKKTLATGLVAAAATGVTTFASTTVHAEEIQPVTENTAENIETVSTAAESNNQDTNQDTTVATTTDTASETGTATTSETMPSGSSEANTDAAASNTDTTPAADTATTTEAQSADAQSTDSQSTEAQPSASQSDTTSSTETETPVVQKTTGEKLADAQKDLDQAKANESSAQQDYNNKQKDANEIKAPADSTIKEEESKEQKAVDDNQKGLDENTQKLSNLEKQKEELVQKQKDLENAKAEYQKVLDKAKADAGSVSEEDYNQAKANADAAQKAYDQAKADLDAKQAEKDKQTTDYNKAVTDETTAKKELDELTAKQSELEKNLAAAQATQKEAQDAYDLITSGEQGEKYKEAVKSLEDAKTALEAANQKVQDAIAARDAASARIAELNQALTKAQSELASITSQQNTLDQAVKDAQTKLDAAQATLTEKQKALTKAQSDYDAHVKANKDLYDDLAKVQAELDAAQKTYEEKKAAYEAALATDDAQLKEKASEKNAEYDKGYAGFIEWLQKETGKDFSAALNAVNRDGHTDASLTEDAATLKHVKMSLLYLKYYNSMRKSLGLSELKVSPYAMAVAINNVNTTRTQHLSTHTGYLPIGGSDNVNEEIQEGGENLMTSYGDPTSANYAKNAFECWYTEEKGLYDSGVRDYSQVGHYLNIINPKWTVTGASFATAAIQNFGYTLSNDPSNAYSVEDFEKLLDEYWNQIAPEKLKYYGINLNIGTAKQEYNDATDKRDALESELQSITVGYDSNGAYHEDRGIAYAQGEIYQAAIDEAQAAVDAAQKVVDSAKADVTSKQQAVAQNKQKQTAKQSEVNQTSTNLANAETDLEAKKTAVTDAQNAVKDAKNTVSERQKTVDLYGATLNTAKNNLDKAKAATTDAQTKVDDNQSKVNESTTKHNSLVDKVEALKASLDSITSDTEKAQTTTDAAKEDAEKKASVASDLRAKLDAIINAQKNLDQTIADIQTTNEDLAANENDQITTKALISQFETDLNTHKIRLAKIQKARADLDSITADSELPWEEDLSYSYGDDTMDDLMPAMTEYRDALKVVKESKADLDKATAARKKAQDKYNEIKAVFDREEANKRAIKEAQAARARMMAMASPYGGVSGIGSTSADASQKSGSDQLSDSVNTGAGLDLFSAELAAGLAALGMVLTSKKRKHF